MDVTRVIQDGADCYSWKESFAVFPIRTINGKQIWWEKVFKRRVWLVWGIGFRTVSVVQYATAFDILTDPFASLSESD